MEYTITILEEDYRALISHLELAGGIEKAAYALAHSSMTEGETRLLISEIIPVEDEDVASASSHHMQILAHSFLRAMKKAANTGQSFLFVHSHPPDVPCHSSKDDEEERELFRTAYNRIGTSSVHGSVVISSAEAPKGRVWLEHGGAHPIAVIRSVGNRYRFFTSLKNVETNPQFYDRQIRAFGPDLQRLLKKLTIGIVGLGGTGSSVAEQLIRLGVGRLYIVDGQAFESSNVNRVYGSKVADHGLQKTAVLNRLASEIGLGTVIRVIPKNITYKSSIEIFRECDALFGCTDDEWGRSILTRLAVYYLIPVFDMGIKIDSSNGLIKAAEGRVTTLIPGEACLYCRERINAITVRMESLQALNPTEAEIQRKQGYAPELAERAPAVIPFTTSIASVAVLEFLHRLTGFLGNDRVSSEVIYQYHEYRIRTNRRPSDEHCFCNSSRHIGAGDVQPFLGLTWRPESS